MDMQREVGRLVQPRPNYIPSHVLSGEGGNNFKVGRTLKHKKISMQNYYSLDFFFSLPVLDRWLYSCPKKKKLTLAKNFRQLKTKLNNLCMLPP
jgi:hypothetical protein